MMVNVMKLSLEQQVEWMGDELPANATLEEFAEVYRQLLADRVTGDTQKRLHCLKLYGLFNPGFTARKECELQPPSASPAGQGRPMGYVLAWLVTARG